MTPLPLRSASIADFSALAVSTFPFNQWLLLKFLDLLFQNEVLGPLCKLL